MRHLFENKLFPIGKTYEDVHMMHQIIYVAKKVVTISQVLYHYRIRESSITNHNTANNLIDYADAYISICSFVQVNANGLYLKKRDQVLFFAAKGISKVWRWWFGVNKESKISFYPKITELLCFSRQNIPLLGFRSWPLHLRVSALFMHSDSVLSFFGLYLLNQLYRKFRR